MRGYPKEEKAATTPIFGSLTLEFNLREDAITALQFVLLWVRKDGEEHWLKVPGNGKNFLVKVMDVVFHKLNPQSAARQGDTPNRLKETTPLTPGKSSETPTPTLSTSNLGTGGQRGATLTGSAEITRAGSAASVYPSHPSSSSSSAAAAFIATANVQHSLPGPPDRASYTMKGNDRIETRAFSYYSVKPFEELPWESPVPGREPEDVITVSFAFRKCDCIPDSFRTPQSSPLWPGKWQVDEEVLRPFVNQVMWAFKNRLSNFQFTELVRGEENRKFPFDFVITERLPYWDSRRDLMVLSVIIQLKYIGAENDHQSIYRPRLSTVNRWNFETSVMDRTLNQRHMPAKPPVLKLLLMGARDRLRGNLRAPYDPVWRGNVNAFAFPYGEAQNFMTSAVVWVATHFGAAICLFDDVRHALANNRYTNDELTYNPPAPSPSTRGTGSRSGRREGGSGGGRNNWGGGGTGGGPGPGFQPHPPSAPPPPPPGLPPGHQGGQHPQNTNQPPPPPGGSPSHRPGVRRSSDSDPTANPDAAHTDTDSRQKQMEPTHAEVFQEDLTTVAPTGDSEQDSTPTLSRLPAAGAGVHRTLETNRSSAASAFARSLSIFDDPDTSAQHLTRGEMARRALLAQQQQGTLRRPLEEQIPSPSAPLTQARTEGRSRTVVPSQIEREEEGEEWAERGRIPSAPAPHPRTSLEPPVVRQGDQGGGTFGGSSETGLVDLLIASGLVCGDEEGGDNAIPHGADDRQVSPSVGTGGSQYPFSTASADNTPHPPTDRAGVEDGREGGAPLEGRETHDESGVWDGQTQGLAVAVAQAGIESVAPSERGVEEVESEGCDDGRSEGSDVFCGNLDAFVSHN
uniref:Uncharacterized protein n=1 Tax=Chromera velia CCMP2878 TaxID=1169474 RepID=A0A0G4FL58_9ALVE|eukprot:Cvel_17573.t1-p1 / transcript=Cvel_17573.t1 / gene=Cvel_17573 / organism=Chromera_velia_CCMP2878 / gene_product=hypothetical protein / transcript_product=hypothetical protein / location=Cvel_scaffold1412:1380-6283(+) / protein_length=853 / sequence_SO=supercontig / SO=protein_coding / is_pseudo=false